MVISEVKDLFPIEVTTHNLYFHEEASIFSIDSFLNEISTGGGDGVVRLWNVNKTNCKKEGNFNYTTALNSSIKLTHICDFSGHERTVNCVRFSKDGILASASDGGKVILYFKSKILFLRKNDGIDCYELAWAQSKLLIGLSNGHLEVYEISVTDGFVGKLVSSSAPHKDIIQGLAYNDKYSIFISISRDKTAKLFKEDLLLERYSQFHKLPLFSGGRSFFKRICFSKNGNLVFLCNVKNNFVLVLSYPFKIEHWIYKIGPFNSEVVKILENDFYLFIFTKNSLYVYKQEDMLVCIDNICFKSITDATCCGNTVFISSLDGFVSSFKWK